MMVDYVIKKGNYGYDIIFTVQENDGTVKVLTGYTITLKVWSGSTLSFSGVCVITDATNGLCKYTTTSSDFDGEGNFYGELELTKTGIVEDTQTFSIRVDRTAPTA